MEDQLNLEVTKELSSEAADLLCMLLQKHGSPHRPAVLLGLCLTNLLDIISSYEEGEKEIDPDDSEYIQCMKKIIKSVANCIYEGLDEEGKETSFELVKKIGDPYFSLALKEDRHKDYPLVATIMDAEGNRIHIESNDDVLGCTSVDTACNLVELLNHIARKS